MFKYLLIHNLCMDIAQVSQEKSGASLEIQANVEKKLQFDADEALKRFGQLEELLSEEKLFGMQIEKQLPEEWNFQSIVLCDASKNRAIDAQLCKLAFAKGFSPTIVLASTNYKSMLNSLVNSNVDVSKIFLLDCVSRNLTLLKDTEKVFFVDSLRSLSDVQIKIINLIELNKKTCFIFDSLDALLLFHNSKTILKFVSSLNKILRKNSSVAFFLSANQELSEQLSQFFEVIVEVK